MSYRPKLIPEKVRTILAEHIKQNCTKAESAWEFSNQEEDSITGDFLGNLRTADWIDAGGSTFRFYYNKARGRGPNALEKLSGADGIITIELQEGKKKIYKSFVFQAKKEGNRMNSEQQNKMDKFFPKANLVFKYAPDEFVVEGFQGRNIKICDFLIEKFFSCEYGMYGLFYDNEKADFIINNRAIRNLTPKHELKISLKNK